MEKLNYLQLKMREYAKRESDQLVAEEVAAAKRKADRDLRKEAKEGLSKC